MQYNFKILMTLIFVLFMSGSGAANEWAYMEKGSRLLGQGKELKAIEEFKKALTVNPSLIEAYQKLGYIYQYEIGDYKKAIKIYLKGLKHEPNNYQINLNLMYAYFELNNIEKAIEAYKSAAEAKPEDAKFSFPRDKLNLYLEGINNSKKIGSCKKLLALNPSDFIIRELLAEIYLKQKNYQEAKNSYQVLIENGEASGSTYYGLGISCYYLEEHEVALDSLSKARERGEYVPNQYLEMVKDKLPNSGDTNSGGSL